MTKMAGVEIFDVLEELTAFATSYKTTLLRNKLNNFMSTVEHHDLNSLNMSLVVITMMRPTKVNTGNCKENGKWAFFLFRKKYYYMGSSPSAYQNLHKCLRSCHDVSTLLVHK